MDHNAIAAARLADDQEAAAEAACAVAAMFAGVPVKMAEQCDDGECSCPTCPWRETSAKWVRT